MRCNMKKVSIIIACYNHGKFLKQSIESALNQDYKNLEIIVVNDGSTDNSLEIAESFDKVKIISHKNKGVIFARNNAIKRSSGDYILPLDADDYLASNDVVSEMVKNLEKDKSDLVFGNYKAFGRMNQVIKPNFTTVSDLLITSEISVTSLFTRKIFDKVGGYSDCMSGGYEDWEYSIRVAYNGKVSKVEKIIFNYRTQQNSRNTNADKRRLELLNKCALNNKNIYAENVATIVTKFRENILKLQKRIRTQKKIRKIITYIALIEAITILTLILK